MAWRLGSYGRQTFPATKAAAWIEQLGIQGDAAALVYKMRDELDRTTVAGMVALAIDPERMVPLDSSLRADRAALNATAAHAAGEDWLRWTPAQRTDARIEILASQEGMDAATWRRKNQFDLLARWTVGWTIE